MQKILYKKIHNIPTRGFSLVELMVSVSVFAIVMTVSVSTLIVLIDVNARTQSLHSVMSNLSFAIDNVTRNIRTGDTYYCTSTSSVESSFPSGEQDCASDSAIVFNRGVDGVRAGYRLNGGVIEHRIDSGGATDAWLAVTSSNVVVTNFDLTVAGVGGVGTNEIQPTVLILVSGFVNDGLSDVTEFSLQTGVTQRVIDI